MLDLHGSDPPSVRRLDHLVCEVPDIEEAVSLFTKLGFPLAWPVGRFWPAGRTAGVALGGINLEFLQIDGSSVTEARIRTLVFEPTDLDSSAANLVDQGLSVKVSEKWEPDPELLRLRGFCGEEAESPQLICRNAYPSDDIPVDFFLCEYTPELRARLAPEAFPGLLPLAQIIIGTPHPWEDWHQIINHFGLPARNRGVEIYLNEEPSEFAEVVEIRSDRGPLELGDWLARFRFT